MSWEERMSAKAQVRLRAADGERRALWEAEVAAEAHRNGLPLFLAGQCQAMNGMLIWRAAPEPDLFVGYGCGRCWHHHDVDDTLILQVAVLHPWGDRMWWWPVEKCDRWVPTGCDCWCHDHVMQPVAIG